MTSAHHFQIIKRIPAVALAFLLSCTLALCATGCTRFETAHKLQIVATTPILADLARHVAGDRAEVSSIVPSGADPHTYEPSLRDVRKVVYADVAFSNYLLLEPHSVIKMLDANLRPGVSNIALAEAATKYGAEVIPLVENVKLDTIWLGMRVIGTGSRWGATRASSVDLTVTNVEGPGNMAAYLTGTFGEVDIKASSFDGFDPGDGYRRDTAVLPTDAHTHMSWAFTTPGVYKVHYQSALRVDSSEKPINIGKTTITFAVGIDPHAVPGMENATVLDSGHADVTADLDDRSMYIYADDKERSGAPQKLYDPQTTVISVPAKALSEIPASQSFRFLGRPGSQIYQLPQAVLGAHIHGEIDPHLWQNVRNAKAYVQLIRDALISIDPEGRAEYSANARSYIAELDQLDAYVAEQLHQIPVNQRYLITTHDAYAYLAKAYDVKIAGFITPNPAIEPSMAERKKLDETIRNLKVKAVFLEPNLARQSSVLVTAADNAGVQICTIYGDTFDKTVPDYVSMMRFNADSLHKCLS